MSLGVEPFKKKVSQTILNNLDLWQLLVQTEYDEQVIHEPTD